MKERTLFGLHGRKKVDGEQRSFCGEGSGDENGGATKTVVPQLRWVSSLLSLRSAGRIGISELGFDLGFVCCRLRVLCC